MSKHAFTANEFIRLRSWGWRNRGVKQKRGPIRSLRLNGGPSGYGGIELKIKEGFVTACWSWNGGKHHITIGTKFAETLTEKSQANIDHVRAAYQSLLRHECWHGMATSQTEEVVKELRAAGIPFGLFNIFEDARIEHLARNCTDAGKDPGGRFRWQNWEELSAKEIDKPVQWFHLLVWREASAYKSLTSAEAGFTWTGPKPSFYKATGECTRRLIRGFYARAIAAPCTKDLLPIIKDWARIFGVDSPKGIRTTEEINGEHADGTKATGEGESGGVGNGGDAEGGNDGLSSVEIDINPDNSELTVEEIAGIKEFQYHDHYHTWDENKVRRIVNRLTQITASAALDKDELGSTGTRLHLAGVVAQSSQFTRRTTEVSGRRTIAVIVDGSGSMYHTWKSHGGLEFVLALRRLHVRSILDVRVWITGGGKCARLPMGRISDLEIAAISPCKGNETFAKTLRHRPVIADIQSASVTIAWTDGQISDGDVDSRALRQRGVDIIGCAPRDPKNEKIRRNILKHFGRGYLGEAEQLARHIAHYVLNRD